MKSSGPKYATRAAWESAWRRTERMLAAEVFRVPLDEMDRAERTELFRENQIGYRLNGRIVIVEPHAVERIVGPPPDPMLENIMAIAVAGHDHRKRVQRETAWIVAGLTRILSC